MTADHDDGQGPGRREAGPKALARACREAGVRDERVLAAISGVPRARFVPAVSAGQAYIDTPLPIAHGQVTTQPSLSARMIEGLELSGREHVLEVGTGLGFQTALLARLAADVVTIDLWPELVEQAGGNLAGQKIENVVLLTGDGSQGVPERAPYDAIIVSAAFPEVPQPLAEQLRVGGRLVQPIGTGGREEVIAFRRTADGLERDRVLSLASFVRLYGRYAFPGHGRDGAWTERDGA